MRRLLITFITLISLTTYAHANWQNTQTIGGMQTEVYIPTNAPTLNSQRALLVMLHGCNQTAKFFKDDGNWTDSAEQNGMVVAIPLVPNGGKIEGCWDYFGTGHTRTNKYNGYLLNMVDELIADSSYDIDPKQVYIVGLSSGGGQAMVQACLAPEKYAGIALAATPAIGTSAYSLTYMPYGTTAASTRDICEDYADTNKSAFQTQIAAIEYGDNGTPGDSGIDGKLLKKYSTINADMFALIYGAGSSVIGESIEPVYNTTGAIQNVWNIGEQQVISKVETADMGHAWPSGDLNPSPEHAIASGFIDYPAFLTKWFFENNRRADRVTNNAPELAVDVDVAGYDLTISGNVSDTDGTVTSLTLSLQNITDGYNYGPFDVELDENGNFSYTVPNLTDGIIIVSVVATDDLGASTPYEGETIVGELPDNAPIITLSGANPLKMLVGSTYSEPGYAANDDIDGNITANVTVTNNLDIDTVGVYEIKYNVIDSGDNAAIEVIRVINIVAAPACEEFTATVSAHESAGRAYSTTETTGQKCYGSYCFGGTETTTWYAQGSDNNLGTNGSASVTLISADSGFAAGSCPTDPVAPVLVSYEITSLTYDQVVITGIASDADGDINRVVLGLAAITGVVCNGTTNFTCTINFNTYELEVGVETAVSITAYDSREVTSNIKQFTITRPEQQESVPPVISNLNYSVDNTTLTITADIVDIDGDLDYAVVVRIDDIGGFDCANTSGNQYRCSVNNLLVGNYTFKLDAQDMAGNKVSSDSLSVTITEPSACVTATNSEHVAAGRAYEQYGILVYAYGSKSYLGTSTTTTSLDETSAGVWNKCR